MADFVEAYDDLVKSHNTMIDVFRKYVDASEYDGKTDVTQWMVELTKAVMKLKAAVADT
jgi:hypothetical protein